MTQTRTSKGLKIRKISETKGVWSDWYNTEAPHSCKVDKEVNKKVCIVNQKRAKEIFYLWNNGTETLKEYFEEDQEAEIVKPLD